MWCFPALPEDEEVEEAAPLVQAARRSKTTAAAVAKPGPNLRAGGGRDLTPYEAFDAALVRHFTFCILHCAVYQNPHLFLIGPA